MARVDDWFYDFVGRLVQRVPRADWPPIDGEFWAGFRSRLVRYGVTEAVADEASLALMEQPPRYLDGFVEAFLARVKAEWVKAAAARSEAEHRARRAAARGPAAREPSDDPADRLWRALDEPQRDYWRSLVAAGMPFLCRHPKSLDRMAAAWSLDPSAVVRGAGPAPPDPSEVPPPEAEF